MTATTAPRSTNDVGWQRPLFAAAALLALTLIGLNGLLLLQPDLFESILNQNTVSAAASHFSTLDHRIHDVTFGLLYGIGAVGLLAQLRSPRTNIAAQLMAITPFAALGITFVTTNYWLPFGTDFQMYATTVYGGLALATLLLHPAGSRLFDALRHPRSDRTLLSLTAIVAFPLLALVADNVSAQRAQAPDDIHWQLGHYGFMAALGITIGVAALLASLRPLGWRLTGYTTAATAATVGVLSLAYPDVDSSLHPAWALALIVWSAAFAVATHRAPPNEAASPARADR